MKTRLFTRNLFCTATLAGLILLLAGCGQKEPASESYIPGLGEIMTSTQVRHVKLFLAAQQENWPLAAYEMDELEEGFSDAKKYHPTHKSSPVPIKELLSPITEGPMIDLRTAVEKMDQAAFMKAFDDLTLACNACHEATSFGFNVVTRPKENTFTNQNFAPPPEQPNSGQ